MGKRQLRFIALDGEAITSVKWDDGIPERSQKYCLLSSSYDDNHIYSKDGLSTQQIFDWLINLSINTKHWRYANKFIGFVINYDVNQWLRDIPVEVRDKVFAGEKNVYWGDYCIYFCGNKRIFSLKRMRIDKNNECIGWDGITIHDVFGFFSMKFEDAAKQFIGEASPIIRWGKAQRLCFVHEDLSQIIAYNRAENEQLVQMMNLLRSWFVQLDIEPKNWYGPSAVSQHCLQKWKIETEQGRHTEDNTPMFLQDIFNSAYYGGRFEAFKIGHFDKVHSYDINSAYPYAMQFLPFLESVVKWKTTDKFLPNERFAAYYVEWNLPRTAYFGCLPWRSEIGAIVFPKQGRGWYWYPEIEYIRKRWGRYITIKRGIYYPVEYYASLGGKVREIYDLRQRLKEEGNQAQYALKITINAIYGKLCQSIGRAVYNCMSWAGYITSYTRAMLLEATSGHEQYVISFATDGILSIVPLFDLSLSKDLGGWDYEYYDLGGLVLMPGVYHLRKTKDTSVYQKIGHRGYASRLPWVSIYRQLNRSGNAEINARLFVTHKMARVQHLKRGEQYCSFVDIVKKINPDQKVKRQYQIDQIKDWRKDYCDSKIVTIPGSEDIESRRYESKLMRKEHIARKEQEEQLAELQLIEGEIIPN